MSSAIPKAHAILANPPYITVDDKETSKAYRARYVSAHRQYGLGLPFTERMFELAADGAFIAQITSNAFMKREHGARLVAEVLLFYDLQLVVDTSGAYIPGHGTPTVILAARNRAPSSAKVRVVQSRRGEPARPDDQVGRVWSSILHALGAPPEEAPSGAQPIGLTWAGELSRTAATLARSIRDASGADLAEAGSAVAGWMTGAAALVAFNARRALYEGSALPGDEHLARSLERMAEELPCGDLWNPDAGVGAHWRHPLTDAWSRDLRREVECVVQLDAIPAEQRGRTDWLGDLYQGLDMAARKERALCQTPWFVARLLAWLSVDPALVEFGPEAIVLDPSSGTGHLLGEAFGRVFRAYADPGEDSGPLYPYPECARRALAQVRGIEIDPACARLAEWRLMLAYLDVTMPRHLGLVPDDLPIEITVADTLLAGRAPGHVRHATRWPKVDLDGAAPSNDTRPTALRQQLSLLGVG